MYRLATVFSRQVYKPVHGSISKKQALLKTVNTGSSLRAYSTYNKSLFTFNTKQLCFATHVDKSFDITDFLSKSVSEALYTSHPSNVHLNSLLELEKKFLQKICINENLKNYFIDNKFSYLAALTNPKCDLDSLVVNYKFILFLYLYDTSVDLEKIDKNSILEKNRSFLKIIKNDIDKNTIDSPEEKVLFELCKEIKKNHLFKIYLLHKINANVKEIYNRNEVINEELYIFNRNKSGAVYPCLTLSLNSIGCYMENKHILHQDVQDIFNISSQIICLINDIYSFEDEYKNGVNENLAIIYMENNKVYKDEALVMVFKKIQNLIYSFNKIRNEIPNYYPFIQIKECCVDWINGNTEWSNLTPRFLKQKEYLSQLGGLDINKLYVEH